MQQTMESTVVEHIQEVRYTDNRSSNFKGSESSKSPTATTTIIMGTATNVRIVDWVWETFEPQKETLNVTFNHSCQEIPS